MILIKLVWRIVILIVSIALTAGQLAGFGFIPQLISSEDLFKILFGLAILAAFAVSFGIYRYLVIGSGRLTVRFSRPPNVHKIKSKRDVKGLIKVLSGSQPLYSHIEAVEALGELGGIQAAQPLIVLLEDAHKDVAAASAKALGMLHDKNAIEPLLRALKDDHKSLRLAVIIALGQIGDARAVDGLSEFVNCTDKNVRMLTI